MAGFIDTASAITCTYLSIFCPQVTPDASGDGGEIDKGFYQTFEKRVPKPRIPKPGRLVVPGRIDFGVAKVGQPPAARNVEIANAGEQGLEITALDVSGSAAFAMVGTCEQVQPGGVCLVQVQFSPQDAGLWTGTVLVGTQGDIQRIGLAGRGENPPEAAQARKPKPRPKPKPVRKITAPPPPPDPRIEEALRSLDRVISAGPVVYGEVELASTNPTALPSLEDQFHLKDLNYKGEGKAGKFDKNVSSFPVERCRIIPTSSMIPLVTRAPINSQICGAVLAHVAVDVYGPDGRLKLLEMGSTIEGTCEPLEDPDTSRIAVEFTKITRPDGAVIELAKAAGADAMGQSGLVGEKFDRIFDKYGPTAIASTIGAIVAYATASNTSEDGTAVDSPLSAAGDAINQNIAQIVAEELRNASSRKRRIRVRKGTLTHVKPTNLWFFPNPYQIIQVEPKNARLTYSCDTEAFRSTTGTEQNRRP